MSSAIPPPLVHAQPPALEPWLLPGDVLLTTDPDSRLSRAIRWATRGDESHAALVVSAGRLRDVHVIEAVGKIRKAVVGEAYPPDARFRVFRATNIPAEDLELIVSDAHADLGEAYPYWQLLLHLGDAIIPGRPRFFRRFAGLSGRLVCSAILGKWFARAGYSFGSEDAEALTPAEIGAYVSRNLRHWWCVREWAAMGPAA